jgi:hypothetical protein
MSRKPPLSDIRKRLGDRVANIVRSCSASMVNTFAIFAGQTREFIDKNGIAPPAGDAL